MQVDELQYNTQLSHMTLPEYGRNVQRMVDYALTLEDREERNRCARTIVRIMGNMFPHLRDVPDFNHKLWDHLAIMADFKLDIDYPVEPVQPDNLLSRPEKVPYQNRPCKVRHYGHLVEDLIARTSEMEEGPEKERLISMIANHMKKSFLAMNKESAEDRKIFEDLLRLSDGKIKVEEGQVQLTEAFEPVNRSSKKRRK